MMSYLIELYKRKEVDQTTRFLNFMKHLDVREISDSYRQLRDIDSPKRQNPYFVESHNGISSSGVASNRREEHLALALFNGSHTKKEFILPDGRPIKFIDYQTPLKAKQNDKGIGKVDLFGVIDNKHPTVIELKIEGSNADSPLHALLEGLAYCAMVEANISTISEEAICKYDVQLSKTTPVLIVLAPDKYWVKYLNNKKAGNWLPELVKISNELNKELRIEIILLALTDSGFEMGLDGAPAKLTGACNMVSVETLALSL